MSKMFQVQGKRVKTWNPLGGECLHKCVYCWAIKLITSKPKSFKLKYSGAPRLYKNWRKPFDNGDVVFVVSMADLFAANVPAEIINAILNHCAHFKNTTFYLLTKNPARYADFKIPPNCICGATIETNLSSSHLSNAPLVYKRISAMQTLHARKFLALEPLADFFEAQFTQAILAINPLFIYIGFDNYNCGIPEPSPQKAAALIKRLRAAGIEVRLKTMPPL